jgi:hypothetical protein
MPKHLEATLGGGQVAFYTAAATAIPVLLLAYLVEMATLAKRIAQWVDQFAEKGEEVIERTSSSEEISLSTRLLAGFLAPFVSVFSRTVRNGLIVPVLMAAAGLPAAGQVCAWLHLPRITLTTDFSS